MSDVLIALPGECVENNHDGTISLRIKNIPEGWTYGINEITFEQFLNEKVVGYFREPPNYKVITKIEVKLELEGKEK